MKKAARYLILLLIFSLGAYLRLNKLSTVPFWYPDEGSNIIISASLAEGELAYMAFGKSSFITGHPHLFYLLLASIFRVTGVEIVWARLLSVTCGLVSLGLVYILSAYLFNPQTGLIAAAFYAIYPAAVVYNRLAFTYNLLAPLYLIVLYALVRYFDSHRASWLLLAGLCGGLAPITDLAGIALPLFLITALLLSTPRRLIWVLPLLILPSLIWGIWMFSIGQDIFIFDLLFTLSRTLSPLSEQLARLVFFYRAGMENDIWLALGSLGLLSLPRRRARWLLGGLHFGSILLATRTVAIFGIASYFLIPIFPLVAIGLAHLLERGIPYLEQALRRDILSLLNKYRLRPAWKRPLVTIINVLLLFFLILSPGVSMVYEGLFLDYALFTARLGNTMTDPAAARKATTYVNEHTQADDVVLTSPTIAWLIDAQVADFQTALAATGQETQHFPTQIPEAHFRFDPALENASYVIIDPLWRGWASAQMPAVAKMIERVEQMCPRETAFDALEVYHCSRADLSP